MKAATLMIQGTASSVGKSLLVTALCRIFQQDGLRVAPFKSQNMALNSAVTPDGGEIGRAQAVQAEAARIPAEVKMNPILLKPESDRGAQVIVLGRPYGTMDSEVYSTKREELLGIIRESLEDLRSRFDLIVIEGAGSPAEVNLMDRDIANMKVAAIAEAPVLLAGDIDRGGVFASLVGTLELLGDDRDRVAGFLINKFRGNRKLLAPGLDFLEKKTQRPVFGVIPFLPDLRLSSEDSLEVPGEQGEGPLIAIVRYPYLSNFDEFRFLPDYGFRVIFAERPEDLAKAALVVLPGSKNVRHDLNWLETQGFASEIRRLAMAGTPVMGICGGYEMLGDRIDDPLGVEGPPEKVEGLGLLSLVTQFSFTKTTRQVMVEAGSWLPELQGVSLRGYEIHHGKAIATGEPAFTVEGIRDGLRKGKIVGTFVHGLFENPRFCEAMAQRLGARSGKVFDPYDRLADEVRAHLDMIALYRLLGLPVNALD